MTPSLDISLEHILIVQNILERYLPPATLVWVFGSWVKGNAKKFSDLDLALDAGTRISSSVMANIRFDLEESDLPYKVDVLDWNATSESFKKIISDDRVLLTSSAFLRKNFD